MSRTVCAMLKYTTCWALPTDLVSTSSPCVVPESDLRGPWTPTHERECAASVPLDRNSGRPNMYTSEYPADTMAYPCCPRPLQRQHSQRSFYSLGASVGQHLARAGRYPVHGARSRLRQSASLRSGCKPGSGADARCVICPGDLLPQPKDSTLCTVDWVLVHMTTHAASTLTRTTWSSPYGSPADRPQARIYLYFVNKAGRSTASLLPRWPRWGYLVANLAHPSVMPPRRRSDGKSRATLCWQGTRLGKRQRAEARELEQMRSHDRVALPAAPPRSSAGSSMDHLQQPARPAPAEGKGASAQVELSQYVGAAAAPCGCHPGRWPYMAPYCPPMLPLQYLRPSVVEEGRIGEAWAEPVLPAPEPVYATTGAEPGSPRSGSIPLDGTCVNAGDRCSRYVCRPQTSA